MLKKLSVQTQRRTEFIDITDKIQQVINENSMDSGLCQVFVPHTTAGVTINENADPSVSRDIINELNIVIPFDDNYDHAEGNSAAHIKSSVIGQSLTLIVDGGKIQLGTWQGVYFCEFDGSRNRNVWVKTLE